MIKVKKIKHPVAMLLLSTSILSVMPSNSVHASEGETSPLVTHEKQGNLDITNYYYENPIDYAFEAQEVNNMSPLYIPYNETEYSMTNKTLYKKKSWGTVIKNNSTVNDSVSRTVSRTTFAEGHVGIAAESALNWKIIKGEIGLNAEVGFGKSTTTPVSYTWNLPAKTTTTISTGSKAVESRGQMLKYSNGKLAKKTLVDVKYSYDEYSDKVSKPL